MRYLRSSITHPSTPPFIFRSQQEHKGENKERESRGKDEISNETLVSEIGCGAPGTTADILHQHHIWDLRVIQGRMGRSHTHIAHTHTHARARAHVAMQTLTRTLAHTSTTHTLAASLNTQTHTHARTHTHTHTHTHTNHSCDQSSP